MLCGACTKTSIVITAQYLAFQAHDQNLLHAVMVMLGTLLGEYQRLYKNSHLAYVHINNHGAD
jgi:hypothetical protein